MRDYWGLMRLRERLETTGTHETQRDYWDS